jgi:hypothetical protein
MLLHLNFSLRRIKASTLAANTVIWGSMCACFTAYKQISAGIWSVDCTLRKTILQAQLNYGYLAC